MLNIYAVTGDPISHSLSPLIHNFLLKKYNIEGIYLPIKIEKNQPENLKLLWEMHNLQGCNVTMPHKQNIIKNLSYISKNAHKYNSVNTVVRINDTNRAIVNDLHRVAPENAPNNGDNIIELAGFNTDADGFIMSLIERKINIEGSCLFFLGAGGVTGTLIMAMVSEGAKRIKVAARNKQLLTELKENIISKCDFEIDLLNFENDVLGNAAEDVDILINSTPLGMHGMIDDFSSLDFVEKMPKKAVVYDLIYNPPMTSLLKKAEQLNKVWINGLDMLIWQAIFAFERFTGIKTDQKADKESIKRIINENDPKN